MDGEQATTLFVIHDTQVVLPVDHNPARHFVQWLMLIPLIITGVTLYPAAL